MSSSGPAYLYSSSMVEQSAIADKYYLQLADHSFLDLLREAVKSILIFNLPLEELPILHLQKEIYLIYDNRVVKELDVLDTIKQEIRETAKLQKKFLDLSFTHLEKEKTSLSDMRDQEEDPWSISWNRHRSKDTDDSLKKSYNIVASLFCNNYMAFVQSIREITRLLEHLHREGLIPSIDGEKLEESLLEIVTHQFFLQYNCLDLHKVLPIIAQQQKERFIFSSEYGVELRKKITKYTGEPSLYDIFLPHRKSQQELPPCQHENKNELKQLMKEMFLKEFKNNDIISPLLFDERGKLKLFDDYRNEDEDEDDEDEDDDTEEDIIAKFAARRNISNDTLKKEYRPQQQPKEVKPQSQLKKEGKPQTKKEQKAEKKEAKVEKEQKAEPMKLVKQQSVAIKKDSKVEQAKKEVKAETKKDIKVEEQKKQSKPVEIKKEVKVEPVKPQQKVTDIKDKKTNGSPVKSELTIASQILSKQKQTFEIPLLKSENQKEDPSKVKPETPIKVQSKQVKNQVKQKPKTSSESNTVKQQKTKVGVDNKQASKQIINEQKGKKKESEAPQPTRQVPKPKESQSQSLQISTTKIVLSSGTTLQARVTSLTISAQDPDKFNKNINLLKEIHTLRKSMSNAEVLQQLAKDYGQSEIKWESMQDKPKVEQDKEEKEDNEPEESGKKKKKKNKKKKNKKSEEVKEELPRTKSVSVGEQQKVELVKTNSLKKEPSGMDNLTEEEKAIFSNIDSLEIDDKARVECKIEEDVLNAWRKQFIALKKNFSK